MSLEIWNKLKSPPKDALKVIAAGRLKGKSDINPQWRYEAMTDVFGECGKGWKYEIVKLWTEEAPEGQVFCFAQINLYTENGTGKLSGEPPWNDPIPGVGGSMLIAKETAGLHANDEAFKMAITDALSVAMKMLGMAADIYRGFWDGSKYNRPVAQEEKQDTKTPYAKWQEWAAANGISQDEFDLLLTVYDHKKMLHENITDKFTARLQLFVKAPKPFKDVILDHVKKRDDGAEIMDAFTAAGITFDGDDKNYLSKLPEIISILRK